MSYQINQTLMSPRNDLRLHLVPWPVLLINAEDDQRVPFSQGLQLYNSTVEHGQQDIKMITFAGSLGYGHSEISGHPGLPRLLASFMEEEAGSQRRCRVEVAEGACVQVAA